MGVFKSQKGLLRLTAILLREANALKASGGPEKSGDKPGSCYAGKASSDAPRQRHRPRHMGLVSNGHHDSLCPQGPKTAPGPWPSPTGQMRPDPAQPQRVFTHTHVLTRGSWPRAHALASSHVPPAAALAAARRTSQQHALDTSQHLFFFFPRFLSFPWGARMGHVSSCHCGLCCVP